MKSFFRTHNELSHRVRYVLPLITMLVVLILDRISKELTLIHLQGSGPVVLIPGVLGLQYVENTGMAFGLFSNVPWLLFAVRCVGLLLLLVYLFSGHLQKPLGYLGLSMAIAGGISNIIDVLLYGYVVHMIEFLFVRFAVFNVADSFITVGAVLIGIYFVFQHHFPPKERESEADHDDQNSDS